MNTVASIILINIHLNFHFFSLAILKRQSQQTPALILCEIRSKTLSADAFDVLFMSCCRRSHSRIQQKNKQSLSKIAENVHVRTGIFGVDILQLNTIKI